MHSGDRRAIVEPQWRCRKFRILHVKFACFAVGNTRPSIMSKTSSDKGRADEGRPSTKAQTSLDSVPRMFARSRKPRSKSPSSTANGYHNQRDTHEARQHGSKVTTCIISPVPSMVPISRFWSTDPREWPASSFLCATDLSILHLTVSGRAVTADHNARWPLTAQRADQTTAV